MAKRWFINSLGAFGVLCGIVWLLSLQAAAPAKQDRLILRELSHSVLAPPPPPPPSSSRPQPTHAVNLAVSAAKGPVALAVMEIDVPLPSLTKPTVTDVKPLVQTLQFDSQSLIASLSTFGLDELDELPRLLAPISVRLPQALRQQGVKFGQLKLHIIIHETGKVELVTVNHVQYSELHQVVDRIIKQARFSSPRREGQKVKAEFIWPVKVSA